MLRILSIGGLALPTFPLLLLVAFWVGLWLSAWRAKQLGLEGDYIYNAGLYGLIAGFIGARVWYVLSHWDNYAPDLTQAFSLSRSALSAGEGFMIGALVALVYLQRSKVALNTFLDAVAPGLAIALVIGHIGALLGGVALGLPSDVPWAVEIFETSRHPIQLYEAGASLMILVILYFYRDRRPWSGFHFWLLVTLYGLSRLLLEPLRDRPMLIGDGYLAAQVLALAAIVIALAVMAYNFSHASSEETPAESL